MHTPRLASFGLWALTAFILVSIFLKYEPAAQHSLPPVSAKRAEAAFDAQSIAYLFQAQTPVAKDASTTKGSLILKGIAYTTTAGQSRALIQTAAGKLKQFKEGQRLPNGAQLVHIDRRAITYEDNGTRQQVQLPQNR